MAGEPKPKRIGDRRKQVQIVKYGRLSTGNLVPLYRRKGAVTRNLNERIGPLDRRIGIENRRLRLSPRRKQIIGKIVAQGKTLRITDQEAEKTGIRLPEYIIKMRGDDWTDYQNRRLGESDRRTGKKRLGRASDQKNS